MVAVIVCVALSFWTAHGLGAEVFTFDSEAEWRTWQIPQNLVSTNAAGHLGLVKFRKDIDPVRNAGDFFHDTLERKGVQGGIWRVGSNPTEGANLLGIQSAILALLIFMAWAVVHYVIGARTYRQDLEAKNA